MREGLNWWDRSRIRTYEFLNYYDFGYPAAEPGTVRVVPHLRPVPGDATRFELQIGVASEWITDAERRPINLTMCMDTSGSMGGAPIELLREVGLAITSKLKAGDMVSVVEWDTTNAIHLDSHEVTGSNDPVLVETITGLRAGGGTDLHGGLVAGYQLARKNFRADRINRVILVSDGGANTGITDEELIAAEADDADGEAIYLIGVGVGQARGYNDKLMDTVTDKGKGAYVFIDSAAEARKQFADRLLQNLEVAARDVRVELTMPAMFEMDEFHGEQHSEDPDEVEPQHLAPNDAMVYHQIIRSCTEEIPGAQVRFTFRATYKDPFTREAKEAVVSATLNELLASEQQELIKGGAIVAYAELFKGPDWQSRCAEVRAEVQAAAEALDADPELIEIASLLASYCGL